MRKEHGESDQPKEKKEGISTDPFVVAILMALSAISIGLHGLHWGLSHQSEADQPSAQILNLATKETGRLTPLALGFRLQDIEKQVKECQLPHLVKYKLLLEEIVEDLREARWKEAEKFNIETGGDTKSLASAAWYAIVQEAEHGQCNRMQEIYRRYPDAMPAEKFKYQQEYCQSRSKECGRVLECLPP